MKRIRKGQRIIEYVGEIIDREEESRRYDENNMEKHHTFLFGIDDEYSIDAGRYGNEAKYINHSCEPNCESVNEDGRIYIYAIKNIQPGVELTYDYNLEAEELLTKDIKKFYECRCGASSCRGTTLSRKSLLRMKRKSSSAK